MCTPKFFTSLVDAVNFEQTHFHVIGEIDKCEYSSGDGQRRNITAHAGERLSMCNLITRTAHRARRDASFPCEIQQLLLSHANTRCNTCREQLADVNGRCAWTWSA